MAFKADRVVMALEYDFRPFVDTKGVTPEPSDKAVRTFQFKLSEIINKMNSDNLEDASQEEFEEHSDAIVQALAELTQGEPTYEEITALPFRIQRAYIEWIRKELTDPEAPSAATKPSLKGLPGGARTTR